MHVDQMGRVYLRRSEVPQDNKVIAPLSLCMDDTESLWKTLVEGIIKASLPPPKAKDDDHVPPPCIAATLFAAHLKVWINDGATTTKRHHSDPTPCSTGRRPG